MEYGLVLAFAGAAFATFVAGIGSSIGLGISGRSATGILSEKPEQYGLLTLLMVLPSTQGIYGLVISLFIMLKINLFGDALKAVTLIQGLQIFAASLPVGIAGWISGIHQGKICAAGIQMAARRPEMGVKAGVVYAAMIEFYAILGFLVSFLLLFIGIKDM